MAKFTFLANQPGLVQIGTIIDLSASKTDPSGVEGSVDGKPVGIISNDPNLAFGKKSAPAKKIRESVIDHPQCASARGLVLSCKTQQNRQNKTLDYLYETELYVVPKRTANKSEKTDSLQYLVGGRSVTNPKKAELIGQLQALKNDGKPIAVRVQILRIGTTYSVVLPENPVAGASAGTIKTPDDILSQLVQDGETYPAAVVALNGRDYTIEILPEIKNLSDYYPLIDAAVARCAGQSKVIESKVETMLSSRFEKQAIETVLAQMPSLGLASRGVPTPKTRYAQRSGNNLADLTCYMLAGKMVRLVGEKGSGKNTLVETACWVLNRPMCRVQGSAELDKLDLLGSRTLKNGDTGFELSEFLQTLQNDGIAVIDEANTVRPEVLTILHSLTDGARSIDVPGYGTVRMGPHACILYTMNEDYVGTGEMNAATIDRGPTILVEQEQDMSALLKAAVPEASKEDINTCCKVSSEIRSATQSGSGALTADAITVRGYIDALQCAQFIPLRRALIQNVANKAQSAAERTTIEAIITANVA